MRQSCLKFFSLLVLASTPAVALEKWDAGKLVASHVCLGCDLRGAHFFGTNLIGANLSGASLAGGSLIGTALHRANLRGADLRNVFLFDANLSGADLRNANLEGAYFCRTVMPSGEENNSGC